MLGIVILAAGKGKRMHSSLPKALHLLAGKPLLQHLLETTQHLKPSQLYVVYGYSGDKLVTQFKDYSIHWVEQLVQQGTAHALAQAVPHLQKVTHVLILSGDIPLITVETLKTLIANTPIDSLGLITMHAENPEGLGRILRDSTGSIVGSVEDRDATPEQKKIKECYSGTMLAPVSFIKSKLPTLKNNNAQKEYYLPDLINEAAKAGINIVTVFPTSAEEMQGVNDHAQLALLERYYQRRQAQELLLKGLRLTDPDRFDLKGKLNVGLNVVIDVDVIIEGQVSIGANTSIGPYTILRDTTIGDNVDVKSHCIIEKAVIADHCKIGPFARIRPDTQLGQQVHIGNFVEIKNSVIKDGSKINHLSYVGDASVGQDVNIGAGCITCNYDGITKHRTVIEDKAFIGSNVALIAPIVIGEGATIGAGSTISHNAIAHALTLTRAKQKTKINWKRLKSSIKKTHTKE